MARIAHRHPPARLEEGRDYRRCEGTVLRQSCELLIEQPNELGLIQTIDESPH
jgi:hypothetical protein